VYRSFSEKNIIKVDVDKTFPLILSFDFNVLPCVSVTAWQIKDGNAYCIDEFYNFGDGIEQTCKKIREKYNDMMCIVTGDPSGRAQNLGLQKGNFFNLIRSELGNMYMNDKILPAESVLLRSSWINKIFGGNETFQIFIDDKCSNTINDLREVRWDKDNKNKSKSIVKKNGLSYQEWGHLTDTLDYFLCSFFPEEFKKFKGYQSKIFSTSKQQLY
jgi:hypothetical protein